MKEFNRLTDMVLHDALTMGGAFILRVPGGWIYRFWDYKENRFSLSGVFVPFAMCNIKYNKGGSMKNCTCALWRGEETRENSTFNWDRIRESNFCPFCGKALSKSREG